MSGPLQRIVESSSVSIGSPPSKVAVDWAARDAAIKRLDAPGSTASLPLTVESVAFGGELLGDEQRG